MNNIIDQASSPSVASSSDEEEEFDVAWAASEYRSRFCRDVRGTNALNVSALGPTKVRGPLPWSKHLSALLCGVHDKLCPLHVLRGHEQTILPLIYQDLVDSWRQNIVWTPPAHNVGRAIATCAWDEDADGKDYEEQNHTFVVGQRSVTRLGRSEADRPEIAFSLVGLVEFPTPTGRNVNMLPFVMGNKYSLPESLRPYYDPLIAMCPVTKDEYGKVVYLTVSEGFVDATKTQRRSGLHIEAASGISQHVGGRLLAGTESNWGGGVSPYLDDAEPDQYEGGLYMASNMSDTCEIWDALIAKDQGIVDYHGGGEHLRPFIGKGTLIKANELVWLTDRTPHEALPQAQSGYRQFFRLVTSNITVWYQQHSTPNPRVKVPGNVIIVKESKFETNLGNSKESKCDCSGGFMDAKATGNNCTAKRGSIQECEKENEAGCGKKPVKSAKIEV